MSGKGMQEGRALGIAGFGVLAVFGMIALAAGLLVPYDPGISHHPYLPPSQAHWLGTNDVGYDVFSELLYAARVSLTVGFLAAVLSIVVGTLIGLLSGYLRGPTGELLTGIIDIVLLLPPLPLMIILTAYLGPSIWNVVAVIGLLGWCSTARVVRSRVLQLREVPFVESARAIGVSEWRIIMSHVLPNTYEVVSAKFALTVAGAMLSEAALSFMGLGDPNHVSWGGMIHYAFTRGGFVNQMWYWYLPPGLCIAICAMGFVLIGMRYEVNRGRQFGVSGAGD